MSQSMLRVVTMLLGVVAPVSAQGLAKRVTASDGLVQVIYPSRASACGDDQGWYYDDPSAPTKIVLCNATCDLINADPTAEIDIVLGCMTIPK